MRFALASDTHNEFYGIGNIPALPKTNADYLILAGDIQTVKSHDNDWWDSTCKGYKTVFYIPGNHEYYGSYFSEYPAAYFPKNVVVAGFGNQNSLFTHIGASLLVDDGVSILLGTMWSDLSDPQANSYAKDMMNDYRNIKYSRDRYWFNPDDTTMEYQKFMRTLNKVKPDVVITHHAPSIQSLNPAYSMYKDLNKAYYSDTDMTGVKLWMHGHTHYPVDYTQDGCRVVSNPMGYPGEIDGFTMKVFEV